MVIFILCVIAFILLFGSEATLALIAGVFKLGLWVGLIGIVILIFAGLSA